jgi:hypothetical protein
MISFGEVKIAEVACGVFAIAHLTEFCLHKMVHKLSKFDMESTRSHLVE